MSLKIKIIINKININSWIKYSIYLLKILSSTRIDIWSMFLYKCNWCLVYRKILNSELIAIVSNNIFNYINNFYKIMMLNLELILYLPRMHGTNSLIKIPVPISQIWSLTYFCDLELFADFLVPLYVNCTGYILGAAFTLWLIELRFRNPYLQL